MHRYLNGNRYEVVFVAAPDGILIDPRDGAASSTLADRSGTLSTGGTAQNAAPANAARRGFWFQNNSAGTLWINTLATAVQSQPSLAVPSGAYFETPSGSAGTGAISVIGATTSQAWSCREW